MALEEKHRALRGDGFQIATIKLPECPLCKRIPLAFISEDNNAVPYCSVCRCTFSLIFRGEIERVGTTLFVKIYPNLPYDQLIPHLFDPKEIDSDAPQEAVDTSLIVNQVRSHPSKMKRATHQDSPPESPNAHKDVAGQILEYLREHGGTGTTKQMRDAIGCSPQGFKDAADKLITEGRIRRAKHGIYELINPS